jgi:hypothetical protein
VRSKAFWTILRRQGHWGDIVRVGYGVEPAPEPLTERA